MMVGGRVLALAILLVVFVPPAVSAFSKIHGQSSLYSSNSYSHTPSHHSPAKPSVAVPPKSYSHTPSYPSHSVLTPAKPYVALNSQPPHPGYGSSSPVGFSPFGPLPVGFPVFVWPGAKPHPDEEEEEGEQEELKCDKTIPTYLPRELFTPQDEAAMPAQNTDLSCDFEADLCSWTQDGDDDFDWTRESGTTPTSDTGPSGDHTSGTGVYVYIAASDQTNGKASQLVSPEINDGSAKCLTFWYHRLGSTLGTLTVYIRTDSQDDYSALTISSPSEDVWKEASLSLPSSATQYQIVIEATTTVGSENDIAIDDISFATGTCGSEPEPSFFVALNDRLKADHCHKTSAIGCKRFGEDGPFQAIVDYTWNFCERDFSNPEFLEDLIISYCTYHSADNAVKMAYHCSTGCNLADNLNQVCHVMKLVRDCPDDDFDLINGGCYRLSDFTADWTEAAVTCQESGALLASITSEAENDALQDLLTSAGGGVWLGLTDLVTEGEFHWLGSTVDVLNPVVFDNFLSTEPDTSGDCVRVLVAQGNKWGDRKCDRHEKFLCEKNPTLILDHPAA